MAIADLTTLRTKIEGRGFQSFTKGNATSTTMRPHNSWTVAPFAGTAPTTAVACNRSTAGALPILDNAPSNMYLVRQELSFQYQVFCVLIDRLSHQGGLSGTATTAQTTNLPTAALTRHTDGVGVMAAIQIYTALGTTATTVSASYTNSAGTAGKTTPLCDIGGSTYNAGNRFLIFPLAEGDVGIKSVESVTLTATTGTVGNFGITLFKPLIAIPTTILGQYTEADGLIGMGAQMPKIEANACLDFIMVPNGGSSGFFLNKMYFVED